MTTADLSRTSAGSAARADLRQSVVLRVRALTKHFRREDRSIVPAVDEVSLDMSAGEFVVLLGPSGCGKTTLLRCIAGLEKPDSGSIEMYDRKVYSSAENINTMPEGRHVGMVFQSYALWPHMSAFDNVAYPLRARKVASGEIAGRVHDALRTVGIPELAKQFPGQMSGGQQQRVALARASVSNNNLVLFDEPLSNVDAKVREQLRIELLEMQQKLNFAALYVTHDQTEAMALANRVAVMRKGKIAQLGSPRDVYDQPNSRYVSNFIGTSNEIPGQVVGEEDGFLVIDSPIGTTRAIGAVPGLRAGSKVSLVFRPERCALSANEPASGNRWLCTIDAALFLGSHTEHVIHVGERAFLIWSSNDMPFKRGETAWLSVASEHLRAVPAEEG